MFGSGVYSVESLHFIQIAKSASREAREKNEACISMIKNAVNGRGVYFSPRFSLTLSTQSLVNRIKTKQDIHKFKGAFEDRFMLNFKHCEFFFENHLEDLITPLIYGFFEYKEIATSDPKIKLEYAIISRKDVRKLGRRFLSRGADKNGTASNFVETEQIMIYTEENTIQKIASYMQIRGSIPFLWSQLPGFGWEPVPKFSGDDKENQKIMKEHFVDLIQKYDKIKVINLVDMKKNEGKVGNKFTEIINSLQIKEIGYEWFNFHEECKKMHWENISKLMAKIEKDINGFGYFIAQCDISRIKNLWELPADLINVQDKQKGILRSNCMDSLDRTGVVQSVIARNIMHKQLSELGLEETPKEDILSAFEPFVKIPLFENVFRNLWTDNADQLSLLYAGSKALKTDFTRTGKRTIMGSIWDGKNSLQRYYIGRFSDGYYQDSQELAAGTISPINDEIKESSIFSPVFTFILTVFLRVLRKKDNIGNNSRNKIIK